MTQIIKMAKRFDYSASGEFNAAFAAALKAAGENNPVYLDCLEMDYMDSAGIGLLVMSHKKALVNRNSIIIINIKPSAREILLLANLQKLIEIR
jgi:anti-anti-sigma factor